MMRYLRGYAQIMISGAEPERCLNMFAARDVAFWAPEKTDALHLRCRIYQKDLDAANRLASAAMCTVETELQRGLYSEYRGLLRRPLLLLGVAGAFAVTFFLQNFIWVITVSGNEQIPTEQILLTLEQEGVTFGAWGPSFEQESLKNRMLNRLPQLRWLALNRTGAIARVLTSEREGEKHTVDRAAVSNLIAKRPGVITRVSVLNGFAAVQPGDAVITGQLLVSGFMDWTTHTQATRALGEIYADTFYDITVKQPSCVQKKTYTREEFKVRTLIFGRKRIKLTGKSGILGTTCDTMIKTRSLTLPGGYLLPVALETVTLRPYTLTEEPVSQKTAEHVLQSAAKAAVARQLVAGSIKGESHTIQQNNGALVLRAGIFCEEMIAVSIPADPLREEETNGESDQR